MSEIDGRPLPYVGIGGVVGADVERGLAGVAADTGLGLEQRGRRLLLSANSTHLGQMMERVDHRGPGKDWNPQDEAQLREALSGEHDTLTTMTMATIQLNAEFAPNPGYREIFTRRTVKRATWADTLRFNGLPMDAYTNTLLAEAAEKKGIAVEFPLPTLEELQADGALEQTTEQLAHYAKVLDYLIITGKDLDIAAARMLLEAAYDTPELSQVGFAIESRSEAGPLEGGVTELLGQFPDLSIHAEQSLHPKTEDRTEPVDVALAREYVYAALAAIEAGEKVSSK